MIFTSVKKKTNELFLNKKLLTFKQNRKLRAKDKIKKVLFLTDEEEKVEALKLDLSTKLNISKNEIYQLVYKPKPKKEVKETSFFSSKDFDFFGKIKTTELKDKLTNHFDLLINYCKVDNVYTNQLLLQCNSGFNVGLSHQNKEIYDFIINCDLEKVAIINLELKKYLTILNKL